MVIPSPKHVTPLYKINVCHAYIYNTFVIIYKSFYRYMFSFGGAYRTIGSIHPSLYLLIHVLVRHLIGSAS